MTPRVSVLIPCYNAERFVAQTLNSIFDQTWPNLEIIVVDDGSTDRSAEIVRSVGKDRVKLIQQENRGQTAALNACLAQATGDFIQFIDADDLIDPRKIELQVSRLIDSPNSVASSEWGRFYDDQPANTRFVREDVYRDLSPIDWLAISRADGHGMMMPALWLIPVAVARAAGPWREDLTLNNDAEYFTRVLLKSDRVLFCEGARCRYRSGIQGSLSGQRGLSFLKSQAEVLRLVEGYLLDAEDSERMRRAMALSWQHFAHAAYMHDRRLSAEALSQARRLHPVTIRPDGGPAFKVLSGLLGWRLARRLQARMRA